MTSFYVDFDGFFAFAFVDAPGAVRAYYEKEFPDRVQEKSTANVLVSIRFEKNRVDNASRIGARGLHTDTDFFLHDNKGHYVKLDFAAMSPNNVFEIQADPDVHVRFLHQVIEPCAKALAAHHGHIFIHSSSFGFNNKRVLIAAWAHTGKTNTLLSFLQHGADFYGDDWTILSNSKLVAYPKTLNLFGYNFALFPELKSKMSAQFRSIFGLTAMIGRILKPLSRGKSQLAHYATTLLELVQNQGHVRLVYSDVFPETHIGKPEPVDLVILPQRSGKPIAHQTISAETFAQRISPCLRQERSKLSEWYAMYQFAFPGRTSSVLDQLERTEHDSLVSQLQGTSIVQMSLGNGKDIDAIRNNITAILS